MVSSIIAYLILRPEQPNGQTRGCLPVSGASPKGRRSWRVGSQAEGLLCNSREQVRLRRTPPPDGDATEPPDPERVVYSHGCVRRDAYATPAGSNGMGVGVSVGGVPPRRDLPAATVGQPFRLHQGTARQSRGRQPADPLRQHAAGPRARCSENCPPPKVSRPPASSTGFFLPYSVRKRYNVREWIAARPATGGHRVPQKADRYVPVEGDRSKDRPRARHIKEAIP